MLPHWIRYIPFYLPWLALLGWLTSVSWFFTDDAFTSFRYARNLLEGHGLVFNPGEYVEGYSNFLWVLELAAIWALFDLAPEHTAQWLSVAFTAATLAAMLWWIAKLPGLAHRGLTIWMALGLVCSSATFATWTSGGGLETRQFTFFILLAVVCLSLYRDRRVGLLAASLSLAAAAYTRPEGPLIACLCFGWFVIQRYIDQGRRQPDWRDLGYLVVPCVVLVAAHFLFRYAYYGEWLPNTYYAKFVRPWYELGFIYLQAGGLVTGLYLLIPLAWVGLRQRWRDCRDGTYALVFLLIAVHAFYLMRVGGDLFEWRPLDFYWPLLAPAAAQGIVRLSSGLSNWLHSYALPRLSVPLRSFFAAKAQLCAVILFVPALFYASAMQGALLGVEGYRPQITAENARWLLAAPGMPALTAIVNDLRWELNKQFVARGVSNVPAAQTTQLWAGYADMERGVIPEDAVGYVIWLGRRSYYLPDLKIVDHWGLTDHTIARNPVARPNGERVLAHDREPPSGYLEQRGVNFRVYPPAHTIGEALTREDFTFSRKFPPIIGQEQYARTRAEYAVKVGEDLYMPFDSPDRQWVLARFGSRELVERIPYLISRRDKFAASEPVLKSDFAVYLDAAERMLVYVKETCRPVDTEARFFLHIYPIDPADLPPQRQVHYFDNRDFSFDQQGARDGQVCIGIQSLPNYPIAAVRTGQFVGDTELWEGEIRLKPE